MPRHPLVRLLAALALILPAACSSLEGSVEDDRYSPPGDAFSIPVPEMTLGAFVHDRGDEEAGMVAFVDEFGALRRIDWAHFPAESEQLFADPERADEALRHYLHEVLLPGIKVQSPGTAVDSEELVVTPGLRAWFALVTIPESSTLEDMGTHEHLDGQRGMLILYEQRYVYVLSLAVDGMLVSSLEDPADVASAVRDILVAWKSTIDFQ